MIRVGSDKRRIHSAELLLNGLVECMKAKDFTEISISDLQKASGVSRATFYRLFDNTRDVLAYKCHVMATEIPVLFSDASDEERSSFLLFTLRYWLSQHEFLEAIFKSGRADILQKALIENSDYLRSRFPEGLFSEDTLDYLVSAALGILSSLLITWVKHGQKETPEELFEIFKGFGEIAPALFSPFA